MNNTTTVPELRIKNWRSRESGSLLGFFSTILPNGLIVHDCSLFKKSDRRWIAMPTRAYESGGERKFAPIVEFSDHETENRFREQTLLALDQHFAEANRDQE